MTGEPFEVGAPWSVPTRMPQNIPISAIEGALRHHRDALRPAGKVEVASHLTRLAMHFWQPDRPAEQIDPLIEDYAADLQGFPLDVIEGAMAEWRRSEKWFPKVAEILAICKRLVAGREERARRLERLLWRSANPDRREFRGRRWADLTDEEKQAHEEMMREAGYRPPPEAPQTVGAEAEKIVERAIGDDVLNGIMGS